MNNRAHSIHFSHSRTERPNPAEFTMHTHDTYEIFYFLDGEGTYYVEGCEYPMRRGDILLMRPGEAHYIDIRPTRPYERFTLNFSSDTLSSLDPEGWWLTPFTERNAGRGCRYTLSDFEGELCSRILSAFCEIHPEDTLQALALLPALLGEVSRAFHARSEEDSARSGSMRPIIRYINANLAEPLSLDMLCERFYISKPQLCRAFRRATGTTVWEYITVKRLLKARRHIAAGETLAAAAAAAGFADYTGFYRAYKSHYGTAPSK